MEGAARVHVVKGYTCIKIDICIANNVLENVKKMVNKTNKNVFLNFSMI